MSTINDGGPAYPVSTQGDFRTGYGHQDSNTTWQFPGMSLRDYFAAKALAALISKADKDSAKCGPKAVPILAQFAYEYADAMLRARSGTGGEG